MSFSSSNQNRNSPSTFSFGAPPASGVNSSTHRTVQPSQIWPRPTLGLGSPQSVSSAGCNATPQFQLPSSNGKNHSHQNTNTSNQSTSNPPYQPFLNTERDANGTSTTTYSYNTITCTPDYRDLSVEEIRLQDYQKGRNPAINNNNISAPYEVKKNEENQNEVLKTQHAPSLNGKKKEDGEENEDEGKDEEEEKEEEEEEESDKNSDSISNQKQQEIPTEISSLEEGFKLYVKKMMKKVIKEEVEQLFKEDEMIAFMQETIKDDIRSIFAEKVKNV